MRGMLVRCVKPVASRPVSRSPRAGLSHAKVDKPAHATFNVAAGEGVLRPPSEPPAYDAPWEHRADKARCTATRRRIVGPGSFIHRDLGRLLFSQMLA